jgi:hypothetical protein
MRLRRCSSLDQTFSTAARGEDKYIIVFNKMFQQRSQVNRSKICRETAFTNLLPRLNFAAENAMTGSVNLLNDRYVNMLAGYLRAVIRKEQLCQFFFSRQKLTLCKPCTKITTNNGKLILKVQH